MNNHHQPEPDTDGNPLPIPTVYTVTVYVDDGEPLEFKNATWGFASQGVIVVRTPADGVEVFFNLAFTSGWEVHL